MFTCSITVNDVIRIKSQSPTYVSFSYYCGNSYLEFYSRIVQMHNWTSTYVLIDDGSILVYTLVGLSIVRGITSLPNFYTTVKHVRDPTADDLQRELDQFRTVSRGIYISEMVSELLTLEFRTQSMNSSG